MEQNDLRRQYSATLHFVELSSRGRAELANLGASLGYHCEVYADISEVASHPPSRGIMIVRDIAAEGGIKAAIARLTQYGVWLPVIAFGDDPKPGQVVDAVKSGALDFIPYPFDVDRFERCLARVGREADDYADNQRRLIKAQQRIERLSPREREVLDFLADGNSNKMIARHLDISPRTVEIHRSNMMHKLGAQHAAEAVRMKIEAGPELRIPG